MKYEQIQQNEASEYVCDTHGKPLQWHEVWRPASHILPKETSTHSMYLCLLHQKEEGHPYRTARIAHYDGVCFYTNKQPILDVDYWLPFPKFLDEAFLDNNGDCSGGRLNLQFPPEVLLYSIASTYKLLKAENKSLLHHIEQKHHKIDELEKQLAIANEIIKEHELND